MASTPRDYHVRIVLETLGEPPAELTGPEEVTAWAMAGNQELSQRLLAEVRLTAATKVAYVRALGVAHRQALALLAAEGLTPPDPDGCADVRDARGRVVGELRIVHDSSAPPGDQPDEQQHPKAGQGPAEQA